MTPPRPATTGLPGADRERLGHRAVLGLAVPIAATQLAQVALTTTDTVMLGLLGTEALAAGGLAIVLFNQIRTMGVGLVTAVGNQVAAAVARGEQAAQSPEPEVRDLLRAAFLLATLAGTAGAALLAGAGFVLPWTGQDPEVAAAARAMLIALAPGLLPCLWFQVIRQYTVGMRRPKALVWITVGSVVVNAGLNWCLIHGLAGLPPLGIAGIGAATSAVHLLTFLAVRAITHRDAELTGGLCLRAWRARPATVRRLARLGAPIAATYGSEAGFFSVVALIMGSLGAAALAAHTAVNQLVYIVFQLTIGLSHAASILVSRAIGGQRPDVVRGIARTALTQAAIAMSVVGAVYLLAPGIVLRLFFDPGEPSGGMAVAATLLLIAAGLQFADTAQNIGVGLLRGLDDTRSGFRLTVIGYWAVGLPLVWLLAEPLGLGAAGAWLGLACGLAATAVLLLGRFYRSVPAAN